MCGFANVTELQLPSDLTMQTYDRRYHPVTSAKPHISSPSITVYYYVKTRPMPAMDYLLLQFTYPQIATLSPHYDIKMALGP